MIELELDDWTKRRKDHDKHPFIDQLAIDQDKIYGTTKSAEENKPGEKIYVWRMDLDLSSNGDSYGDPIPNTYKVFLVNPDNDDTIVTGIKKTLEDRDSDPKIHFLTYS